MNPVTVTARPRVGLLGNPSDGYGGRVIAFTFDDFAAHVTVAGASGEGAPRNDVAGTALLTAARTVFMNHAVAVGAGPATLADDDPRMEYELSFDSDIPRQVGLAGSSAIVVAALSAQARWFGMTIDPITTAHLALWAETRELGIVAGPQDRVVQAHEGVLDMDFASSQWKVERIDAGCVPPMLIAWTPSPGSSSGQVHDDIRRRFETGDPEVVAAMRAFADIARDGVDRLRARDVDGVRALVDRNFDQRATIWSVTDQDRAMVEVGRRTGAAVKFCGSGGAVVAVPRSIEQLGPLEDAYADAGFSTLRPSISRHGGGKGAA